MSIQRKTPIKGRQFSKRNVTTHLRCWCSPILVSGNHLKMEDRITYSLFWMKKVTTPSGMTTLATGPTIQYNPIIVLLRVKPFPLSFWLSFLNICPSPPHPRPPLPLFRLQQLKKRMTEDPFRLHMALYLPRTHRPALPPYTYPRVRHSPRPQLLSTLGLHRCTPNAPAIPQRESRLALFVLIYGTRIYDC